MVETELHERGSWGSQAEFLLSCIAYGVGYGDIWRFPYLAYENGGAVFLILYVVATLLAGAPLLYLELCLGQFCSLGPNCIFKKIVPVFQGIGWAMVMVSFFVSIYYNMIVAWCLIYFVVSFRGEMLWSSCTNSWNTIMCDSSLEQDRCASKFGLNPDTQSNHSFFFNFTCYLKNESDAMWATKMAFFKNVSIASPAEEFFENYILEKTETMDTFGGFNWKLVVALFLSWVLTGACLIKGVKTSGKVVYVTAIAPYVILIILLIRGVTLPGMELGLQYYMFEANVTKLLTPKIWQEAATQVFYSYGIGFGSLITLASYSKFKNNCCRDAIIITFVDCATSIVAGIAIFSILGFIATQQGVKIDAVVQSGIGLAFIAYPEAISRMPAPYVWAVLFFLMMLTLGIDSQFSMVETITTAVRDQAPALRAHKSLVVIAACTVMFLCGLPLCTRAGIFYFTIFDDYSAGLALVVIVMLEVVCVIHIYGLNNFIDDIQLMLGVPQNLFGRIIGPSGYYFRVAWLVTSPLFLLAMIGASLSFQFGYTMTYGKNERFYIYPSWATTIGWIISLASIVCIPIFAISPIVRNIRKGRPWRDLFKAKASWRPAHTLSWPTVEYSNIRSSVI
uniref:Transporter n=1 Tax=Plectus sambesii TaxID=2011161 RepID=A0A914VVV6_9BILA